MPVFLSVASKRCGASALSRRPENLELWETSQPYGQRVVDKVAWALELIDRYPDVVAKIRGQETLF